MSPTSLTGCKTITVQMRYVFVVLRGHPWLYKDLLERFENDPDVGVILDRRIGERRHEPTSRDVTRDRRRDERRRAVRPEEDLQIHLHHIVVELERVNVSC